MKRKLDEAIQIGDSPPLQTMRKLPAVTEPTQEEMNRFYSQLKSKGRKPVLLSLVPGYAKDFRPAALNKKYPLVLSELQDENFARADKESLLTHCEEVFKTLRVTDEEAKNCEIDTRSQANSKQWFRFRTGRITASKIKAACRTSVTAPSISLVKDICYPSAKKFSTAATKWGCQHEQTAKKRYEDQMKTMHDNFQLRECGLFISPKYPFIGATPDAIASCDCCGEVVLEVKCPYCKRHSVISDEIDCLEISDGQLRLKQNHAYFYQVQCQLLLSGMEYCDFVIWTKEDFFTERIYVNEDFCQEMVQQAAMLFRKVILPELVGKLFSRPAPLSQLTVQPSPNDFNINQNELIICVCRSVYKETDNVIGCDNENCKYMWLHFKCVNLKRVPKGKWYCKECRKKLRNAK